VTSTAALAAQRLAADLNQHDVDCQAYSTAGLHAAITTSRVQLGAETTVIHDEAALASTTEQLQLLEAVEDGGARLIEVGDPRQNQPVGAGGLWDQIRHAADEAGAHVQLTRNQRARDPADQRDQALFRRGEIEQAISGYDSRDRVHLHLEQQRAEDQALDVAHADRADGKTTIVIAQTSNDHLDELNARAQAIRRQHGELGDDSVAVPGRPYRLHAGHDIQIRHTVQDPEQGPPRNGTTAQITDVNPRTGDLELRTTDGSELRLDQQQAAAADLRLAYVQHPFPAQGQTTDTTHVIVDDHTTREGSYVALTRARDHTHIYAANTTDETADLDPVRTLADRMSHTEPDVPSIQTPMAHENTITTDHTIDHAGPVQRPFRPVNPPERDTGHGHPQIDAAARGERAEHRDHPEPSEPRTPAPPRTVTDTRSLNNSDTEHPEIDQELAEIADRSPGRTWPRTRNRERASLQRDNALGHDHSVGWEP
jgi:hypothetical protein